MKLIRYSAPGKVILSGEHSVVYGKPALVCAIDKRLTITFTPTNKTVYKDAIMPILEKSVIDFLKKKNEKIINPGFTYSVESTIPIGRGLGSSAAYCAVISAGLLELFTGEEWSKEEINMCAYQMEKYFHKNSSGVDTSTSIMGGLIYYRKEFEFLKTISSLPIKLPKHFVESLILIDTGKPDESTGEMVQKVGELFNKKGNAAENSMNQIERITKRLIVSIMKEDTAFFIENIRDNEKLLEEIGVVSEKTKRFLKLLHKFGEGKITGAGGYKEASGYIIFFSENNNLLKSFLNKNQIESMQFIPSYSGLKKEL
jgi:mevalonate kinase